jgi:hypothetical protein
MGNPVSPAHVGENFQHIIGREVSACHRAAYVRKWFKSDTQVFLTLLGPIEMGGIGTRDKHARSKNRAEMKKN